MHIIYKIIPVSQNYCFPFLLEVFLTFAILGICSNANIIMNHSYLDSTIIIIIFFSCGYITFYTCIHACHSVRSVMIYKREFKCMVYFPYRSQSCDTTTISVEMKLFPKVIKNK